MIVFPISMSRIGNTQSPQSCIDALDFFLNKVAVNRIGANFIYSESLYMNFETDAYETKNKFAQDAVSHMGGVRNLIAKNHRRFQMDHAFSFQSWFQMYLSHRDFFGVFGQVRDFYNKDATFQKHVLSDAQNIQRELDERQLSFFLEEFTFAYLLVNRELSLKNEFVNDREQWVLQAYPEEPLRGQAYLVQQDPLHLNNDSNPYKGQYDLTTNKFISYLEMNLDE